MTQELVLKNIETITDEEVTFEFGWELFPFLTWGD